MLGIMHTLFSDNGTEMVSDLMNKISEFLAIDRRTCRPVPLHPETGGIIER